MTATDDIRLLITDVGGQDQDNPQFVFTDPQIDRFYALRGSNVYKAAALALRTMAANEALVSKRIEFLGLKTDGPAVAKELRALAEELDKTAQDEDAIEGEIDVIEMDTTVFADREMREPL